MLYLLLFFPWHIAVDSVLMNAWFSLIGVGEDMNRECQVEDEGTADICVTYDVFH